jgi:hypothetical protein
MCRLTPSRANAVGQPALSEFDVDHHKHLVEQAAVVPVTFGESGSRCGFAFGT